MTDQGFKFKYSFGSLDRSTNRSFKEEIMEKRTIVKKRRNQEKKRHFEKKVTASLLISSVVLGGILLTGVQSIQASEADGKWEARSIEQIKKDVEGKSEYTIVWGDTLSGISLATNITMDKLASLNGIGDYNLIFAGNKLLFEGNVVTVQDKNGVVTDQQKVTEADKVVPNQPIGESVGQTVQPSSESNAQSQSNSQHTGSTTTSSSEVANQNEGKVDHGNSSGGTNNNDESTKPEPVPTPTPTPTPDPDPTPTPEPQVQYTVWYYVSEGDDSSVNIEKGSRLFSTEAEATNFIEGYADNLLMQGITGSYGVMSWE